MRTAHVYVKGEQSSTHHSSRSLLVTPPTTAQWPCDSSSAVDAVVQPPSSPVLRTVLMPAAQLLPEHRRQGWRCLCAVLLRQHLELLCQDAVVPQRFSQLHRQPASRTSLGARQHGAKHAGLVPHVSCGCLPAFLQAAQRTVLMIPSAFMPGPRLPQACMKSMRC
jgi:hypothetical protein